jgi:hypothetical protein
LRFRPRFTRRLDNGAGHVFWRDLKTGRVVLVSRTGPQGNKASEYGSISGDGNFVIFESEADNLVPGGDANGNIYDIFRRGPLR